MVLSQFYWCGVTLHAFNSGETNSTLTADSVFAGAESRRHLRDNDRTEFESRISVRA